MKINPNLPVHDARSIAWRGTRGIVDSSTLDDGGRVAVSGRVYPDAADLGFLVKGATETKLFTATETLGEVEPYATRYASTDGFEVIVRFS